MFLLLIALCVIFIIIIICTALAQNVNVKHIIYSTIYQVYYYVLGGSAMIDDFVYRRSNIAAVQQLSGNVAVVTGAARGIGVEIVKVFLQCGAHVILGCRNETAGKKAIEKIRQEGIETGSTYIFHLDLASLETVKQFSEKIIEKYSEIHFLVNNAGIMFVPFKLTQDGHESHFAVNYLGHCLLTHLLMPPLIEGYCSRQKMSRIINVSSCAYLAGTINFKDLTMAKDYIPQAAYAQSKLAQILFTNKLEKVLRENNLPVQAHSVHPGIVNTDLFNGTLLKTVAPWIPTLFFKSPSCGAASIVFAGVAEILEGQGGTYISNCHVVPLKSHATDIATEEKLWKIMLELLDISYFGCIQKENN